MFVCVHFAVNQSDIGWHLLILSFIGFYGRWWSRVGNGHKCLVVFIPSVWWWRINTRFYVCSLIVKFKLCCVSTLCWPLLIKKHTVILILCIVKMVSISKVQVWPVYELLKTCVIASCLFVRVYNCDFEIKSIKKNQRMSNFWFYG